MARIVPNRELWQYQPDPRTMRAPPRKNGTSASDVLQWMQILATGMDLVGPVAGKMFSGGKTQDPKLRTQDFKAAEKAEDKIWADRSGGRAELEAKLIAEAKARRPNYVHSDPSQLAQIQKMHQDRLGTFAAEREAQAAVGMEKGAPVVGGIGATTQVPAAPAGSPNMADAAGMVNAAQTMQGVDQGMLAFNQAVQRQMPEGVPPVADAYDPAKGPPPIAGGPDNRQYGAMPDLQRQATPPPQQPQGLTQQEREAIDKRLAEYDHETDAMTAAPGREAMLQSREGREDPNRSAALLADAQRAALLGDRKMAAEVAERLKKANFGDVRAKGFGDLFSGDHEERRRKQILKVLGSGRFGQPVHPSLIASREAGADKNRAIAKKVRQQMAQADELHPHKKEKLIAQTDAARSGTDRRKLAIQDVQQRMDERQERLDHWRKTKDADARRKGMEAILAELKVEEKRIKNKFTGARQKAELSAIYARINKMTQDIKQGWARIGETKANNQRLDAHRRRAEAGKNRRAAARNKVDEDKQMRKAQAAALTRSMKAEEDAKALDVSLEGVPTGKKPKGARWFVQTGQTPEGGVAAREWTPADAKAGVRPTHWKKKDGTFQRPMGRKKKEVQRKKRQDLRIKRDTKRGKAAAAKDSADYIAAQRALKKRKKRKKKGKEPYGSKFFK